MYNDWLAEFCAYSPKRLKGLALISLYDPKQAAEDLADCAKKGLAAAPRVGFAAGTAAVLLRGLRSIPGPPPRELSMPLSLHEFAGFQWVDWDSSAKKRTIAGGITLQEVEKNFAHFDTFRRAL